MIVVVDSKRLFFSLVLLTSFKIYSSERSLPIKISPHAYGGFCSGAASQNLKHVALIKKDTKAVDQKKLSPTDQMLLQAALKSHMEALTKETAVFLKQRNIDDVIIDLHLVIKKK